jgi:membrane-bound serine protease (ClpP class)
MAPAERAKIEAPMLSEVVHEARRHGWDEKLVQAFIAVDAELWLIQNSQTGERLFVDRADFQTLFDSEPPSTRLKRLPPAPARDETTGFLPGANLADDEPAPTAAERARDIEFVQDLSSKRPLISTLNPADWTLLGHIVSADELLVVRADEAIAYGLASGEAATEQELAALFGGAQITHYDESWSERLVRFMTWWPVRGVLITIMLVCFFIEMAAPGYGTFGAAAVAAMAILLAAPLLIGLAEWWTALLVIAGLTLVVVELFVIPGVGAIGVIGGLTMFLGLVGTFMGPDPLGSSNRADMLQGLAITGAAFFASGIIIWLLLRTLPDLPLARRFVLSAEVGGPGSDTVEPMPHTPDGTLGISIGDLGVASTDLRRSGRVELDGRFIEAQSIGAYITKGTSVRVVAIKDAIVHVEEESA